MKKALLIIGMIVIFFAGCKKDDILEASKVEMKDVTMERGWEHVKMSGEYSYPQALEGMKIIVSSNENMSESVEYVCALEGKKFDVTIDNLEAGVTYYYRYEYDNGYDKVKGDKENFVTVGKPVVVTNNVVNITKNSAVLSGSVTNNDVENKINVRGFCWSKNTNPTISGSHNNNGSSSGTGTSSFTYNLSYLESNTKYYVRTYARTDWGVVYGEVKSFVTKGEEPEVPNENGYEYVDLGLPSGLKWATCNVGANSPEAYGDYFAWGEIKTKTSYSSSNYLNNGKQMNDISGNLKYDVATANWGGKWRMPTKAEINELVTKCTWTWTTQNGVNGYNIKSKTNANSIFLPAAGHRHNTSHYYVGEDGHYWSSTPVEDDDIFIYNIILFAANYGVNSAFNRIFGAPVRPVFGGNFTGPEEQPEDEPEQPEIVLPTVTTNSVTNITSNSATCGGNVTSDGNGTVTARGICWSTSQNPTINNNRSIDGTGTGSFTSSMTNLKANTTYYVRAYATNEAGTSYGAQKSFTTLGEVTVTEPTVSTNSVSSITANTAICGGNVTSDGGGTVSARGICWSETSEPKINNLYSEESNEGTGTGSFTSSMTNLKANTTYYVRAYATNEAGTVYGEVKSFMTLEEEPEETISGTENGHDWVDLGLPSGLKWATCNVGANSPEEYGDYFAWGETTTKSDYSSSNCPTYGLGISQLQSQGYIDSEGNLTSQYDAATANWGGDWRMPTYDELNELITKCTWEWINTNDFKGYSVTGPNGNNIFLPAAGGRNGSSLDDAGSYGCYWSSTPIGYYDGYNACGLSFRSGYQYVSDYNRGYGQSVRPVLE